MSSKPRITPEYVRALETDWVMLPHSRFAAFRDFGTEQSGRVAGRVLRYATGVRVLPADRVIDHDELVEFMALDESHLDLEIDIDMTELYALGIVSRLNRSNNGQLAPTTILVHKAVTERVHQIIERRPEILHPKLRFALDSHSDSETLMLRFLLASRVALDADRLHAMSINGGVGQEMLELALSSCQSIGPRLFEETVHSSAGCASSAAAILRAGYDITRIDEHNIQAIVEMCAMGAAGSQWQFDQAIEMLRAIESAQDAAGGDGHRLFWAVRGQNAVNLNDFGRASVRSVHPVTTLIYETMLRSGKSGPYRAADVAGFPGVPFAIMAERINAILEPEGRLPLEMLSGINALKLVTLWPAAASDSAVARDYWVSRSDGDERVLTLANSPMDIVDWACQKTDEDGVRLTLIDLDPIQDRLAAAIGAGAASEIRAKVTHREMAATIAAAGHAQDATPRRRRSPSV